MCRRRAQFLSPSPRSIGDGSKFIKITATHVNIFVPQINNHGHGLNLKFPGMQVPTPRFRVSSCAWCVVGLRKIWVLKLASDNVLEARAVAWAEQCLALLPITLCYATLQQMLKISRNSHVVITGSGLINDPTYKDKQWIKDDRKLSNRSQYCRFCWSSFWGGFNTCVIDLGWPKHVK